MAAKTDIWVYAHWLGMPEPKCIGILSAQQAKAKKAFSFEYDTSWILSKEQLLLDPDIRWYSGLQYPNKKENFGIFLDSMPDTWGRTLMKRRAAILSKEQGTPVKTLYDIDFLLGVYDEGRMGALRFKLDPNGAFLANNAEFPTPPWSTIRELQHGADILESDEDSEEVRKWLSILMAPGSSLGGARPKANIKDDENNLWIAKFPSRNDAIDKAAWEYIEANLHQLWRRIVFNIAVSNTDDHLRNHGFILEKEGWVLSPAYDINPSIDKDSLALTIDGDLGNLDFGLVRSVGEYFRLDKKQMDSIFNEVIVAVSNWKTVAAKIGISRAEQELMKSAFHTV